MMLQSTVGKDRHLWFLALNSLLVIVLGFFLSENKTPAVEALGGVMMGGSDGIPVWHQRLRVEGARKHRAAASWET